MEVAVVSCSGDSSPSITFWNPLNGSLQASYHGGGNSSPNGVDIKGGYVFTNEKNKPMIHAWPLNKQHFIHKRLHAPGKIGCLNVSPNNNYLALSVDSRLHVYQLASGLLCGVGSKHFQRITVIKFNKEGCIIGCGGEDGLLSVWNLATLIKKGNQSPEPFFAPHAHSLPITGILFTSGNLMSRIISSSLDHSFKIFDISTQRLLLTVIFESSITSVALSHNELFIYCGLADGYIKEFSLMNPPRVMEAHYHTLSNKDCFALKAHEADVTSLSCSLHCVLLLSGSSDSFVKVFHINSKQCLQTINQKSPVVNCFFYIPPDRYSSNTFKPDIHLHDFINQPESLSCYEIEVSKSYSTEKFDDLQEGDNVNEVSLEPSKSIKEQIDRLQSINEELFKFTVNNVLKRCHLHQVNDCSNESNKLSKKKKKQNIKK